MAKPQRIILVRHGQSVGNADKKTYETIPDYAVQLTDQGIQQVRERANELQQLVGTKPAAYYVSPYWRTRQTFQVLSHYIPAWHYYEDLRIREQEWSTKLQGIDKIDEAARDSYGHTYARFEGGESNADVYDRWSDFLNTLYRDFKKFDFPDTTIIVTHGMGMRVFLFRFFHMKVEEFEYLANPANAGVYILELQTDGHYKLSEEPRKHDTLGHDYIYNWDDPRFSNENIRIQEG